MSRTFYNVTLNSNAGLSLGYPNAVSTISANATGTGNVFFPDASGTLVLNASVQTLTNKTIVDPTDNVQANLLSVNNVLFGFASVTPVAGQAMIAINATTLGFGTPNLGGVTYLGSTANTNAVGTVSVQSIPVADNTTVHISSDIIARYAGAGSSLGSTLTAGFRRGVGAASLARIGGFPTDSLIEVENVVTNQLTATINPDTTNGAIVVSVVPAAATNASWKVLTTIVTANGN